MPSLIPLDSSLGALFIGVILSTAVYGVTCLQVYNYFMHHSFNDRWFLKLFVIVLWVVDTLHVALLATFYYGYTVTNFGDYEFLAKVYWPLTIQVLIGARYHYSCNSYVFCLPDLPLRREFLGWYEEYLHGGIPESRYSFTSKDARAGFSPHTGYKRLRISRSWVTSKPIVGTDDEFQPSPVLSKSVNTASSSTSSRAHHRTAAVVPVIKTQRASTSGQTSRLTGPGRSGLSSSTLPAGRGGARGAAGPSRGSSSATSVAKPPSSLRQIVENSKIVLLPLTDARLLSFWFLWTVFLQGIFACAEYQSQSEDLEISPANWVTFFDKHSPRMVAYKAKYGKYMATTWSAAFLLGVQRFCTQMLQP
ncbi:hypothetical protein BT96DRAFT_976107 [Gymnopus androsaceus JB14]|uniref:Uncharacterized protein n=1 Tax=Gymnopus androsaceus JB14 TaxID=1447944 RepID=A0A6A4HQJ0_9AGAR|nr:hypothetical protein BT96DRAFT_976107 [Gymnopus androsaceus JB14]